jgi:hypothetical protein
VIVTADDSLQIGIDGVLPLAEGQAVVIGWAMTPRGAATDLAITATPGGDCPILHAGFHARPAIRPADPESAVVNGFILVFTAPAAPRQLLLAVQAGPRAIRADLLDSAIGRDAAAVVAALDPRAAFALLREAGLSPPLAALAGPDPRSYGAFGPFLARLPLVRGRQERLPPLAEALALSAPSGEVVAMLRAPHPVPPEAMLDAALIGYVTPPDGGLPALVPVPLADWHAASLPATLAGYARIDPAWRGTLQGMELVLQLQMRGEEASFLRIQPQPGAVAPMLDALCQENRLAALPVDAGDAPALALLAHVLARREAAFGGDLAALAQAAAAARTAPAPAPRTLLLIGADDPLAARLFHLLAPGIEARGDRLLVIGDAAPAIARVFDQRGRIPVLTGAAATAALREAAARDGVLAIDVARFAADIAAGVPEAEAGAHPLGTADLARLLALHEAAGCGAGLPDSLSRLLRLDRATPGELPFAPVPHAMASPAAAALVNDHLARLWTMGDEAARRRMEAPRHG